MFSIFTILNIRAMGEKYQKSGVITGGSYLEKWP